MSELANVLLIILLVLGCILIGYAIFTLKRLVESMGVLQKEIQDLKKDLVPAIQNISSLSEQARLTLQDIEAQKDILESALVNVRRFTSNIVRVQENFLERVEPPINEFTSFLSGIGKGFQAFTSSWRRNTPPPRSREQAEE